MLTGVAGMPRLVSLGRVGFRPTPYDWVPLAVIILLIVVFVGVYSGGGRSRGHRSGRRTAHRASHVPERGGNHGHRAESKRRPNRP
jgi:hypothetical protein